jgi:AhpD family alkylhydroperoxidase
MDLNINFHNAPKGYFDGLLKMGQYAHKSGLDGKLLELINTRVSQINGCAYCLDMHFKDAVNMGETEQRLYSLPAWRDCPYYTEAERAALAFAEALTANTLPADVTSDMKQHYSAEEIANIALAIVSINSWNRLNKVLEPVAGTYQPGQWA